MFVNYKLNISSLSGTTGTTVNIPINMEYQLVDNAELVERVFVETEKEKSVNPILDYDKTRFVPVNGVAKIVNTLTYNVNFLKNNMVQIPTYYSDIELTNDDIKFRRNTFKESSIILSFYDSDNPLTQNLITNIEIFSSLSKDDFNKSLGININSLGQVKTANQIPVRAVLSNPQLNSNGYYEGYYLYGYKDDLTINSGLKSLYMKATYFNGKTGKWTNLMTEPRKYPIEQLIGHLYTKYDLYRDTTGFYYSANTSYSTNVSYSNNPNPNLSNLTINLYEIQSL